MTLSYSTHFRFGIPDFLTSPWHSDWESLVQHIDRILYGVLFENGVVVWANSHVYAVGDLAVDTTSGQIWQCLVAHTSAATMDFGTDRTAHPLYWQTFAWAGSGSSSSGLSTPIYSVTASNSVTIDADDQYVIWNKSIAAPTTVQLPPVADRAGLPLIIVDFTAKAGDFTILPDAGDAGGIMNAASLIVGAGGSVSLNPVTALGGWTARS